MAQVYASDPASAFAMNANLDQQRVQNYLQSIAANRQAQLQGWSAAAQQAAARQAQEQSQQAQMLQLAHLAAQQQQRAAETAASLGFNQQDLAERIRHNMATEEKPNASKESLDYEKQLRAQQNAELAKQSENVANYLNSHMALQKLTASLPSEAAAKEAGSEDFWHWPPFSDKAVNTKRAAFSRTLADLMPSDVLQEANFTNATGPADYRSEIAKVLSSRSKAIDEMIPKKEAGLNSLVTFRDGKYEPNFRVNPLLAGSVTAPPPATPKVLTPALVLDFLNAAGGDKDAARAAARAGGYTW